MLDALSLRSLRFFVTLAEELHFARAAARLGIAQPGLSQHVRRLEQLLGVRLFNRTNRRVELTEAGHALIPDARVLLQHSARMSTRVRCVAKGETGRVRVGFVASGGYDLLPKIIRRFRVACPDAAIELDACDLQLPWDRLEAGVLDVVIARGPRRHPSFKIETLYREPLCVVLPATHPLVARRRLRLVDLAHEAFAMFPRDRAPEFLDAIIGVCRDAGFVPRITHEAADWQVLASLVAADVVIALAPASVQHMRRKGVCYRPLSPRRDIARLDLIFAADGVSPLTRTFLRVARETAKAEMRRKV
jgi:DNA-binding transcriptional LysR family regulator